MLLITVNIYNPNDNINNIILIHIILKTYKMYLYLEDFT